MDWFEKHKERHNREGGNIRTAHEIISEKLVQNSIADSPTYKIVEINGEKIEARLLTEKEFSVASGYFVMKLLYKQDYKPRNGQYVVIDGNTWLTVHASDKILAPFNYIRECTHTMTFTMDNERLSIPCVLDTRIRETNKYQQTSFVDLNLNGLKITIPHNKTNRRIIEKDRILIQDSAWEVQAVDRLSMVKNGDGFIELACKKVPLSEKEIQELDNQGQDVELPTIEIIGVNAISQKSQAKFKAKIHFKGDLLNTEGVEWSSTTGRIDENGLFTADCELGNYIVKATYLYKDCCEMVHEIEATKKITIRKKGGLW